MQKENQIILGKILVLLLVITLGLTGCGSKKGEITNSEFLNNYKELTSYMWQYTNESDDILFWIFVEDGNSDENGNLYGTIVDLNYHELATYCIDEAYAVDSFKLNLQYSSIDDSDEYTVTINFDNKSLILENKSGDKIEMHAVTTLEDIIANSRVENIDLGDNYTHLLDKSWGYSDIDNDTAFRFITLNTNKIEGVLVENALTYTILDTVSENEYVLMVGYKQYSENYSIKRALLAIDKANKSFTLKSENDCMTFYLYAPNNEKYDSSIDYLRQNMWYTEGVDGEKNIYKFISLDNNKQELQNGMIAVIKSSYEILNSNENRFTIAERDYQTGNPLSISYMYLTSGFNTMSVQDIISEETVTYEIKLDSDISIPLVEYDIDSKDKQAIYDGYAVMTNTTWSDDNVILNFKDTGIASTNEWHGEYYIDNNKMGNYYISDIDVHANDESNNYVKIDFKIQWTENSEIKKGYITYILLADGTTTIDWVSVENGVGSHKYAFTIR